MWTGDGRVFFYNPSSRISVWERPDDLIGRLDVEKMISSPPDAVATANATVKVETRRADDTSDSSGDEDRPAKKMKLEDAKGI